MGGVLPIIITASSLAIRHCIGLLSIHTDVDKDGSLLGLQPLPHRFVLSTHPLYSFSDGDGGNRVIPYGESAFKAKQDGRLYFEQSLRKKKE